MASRMADSKALADRCSRAGWEVAPSNDGWKVATPAGPFVIHKTYSDVRSLKNAAAHLERVGLKDAEAMSTGSKLRAKQAKLEADREEAERRTIEMASRERVLVQKAAGPYLTEPEDCDLDWMLAPHPAPWMRWMYITPEAAAKILTDHNSDNRKISDPTVDRYKYVILSGQWRLTHQGIAFDTRGILQDGQHRFEAIAALAALADLGEQFAGVEWKIPFAVFVGMPQENFMAIDENRVRTAAQMLAKVGLPNANNLFTLLRTVAAFDSGNPLAYHRRGKMAAALAFDAREKDPDGFDRALRWGLRVYQKTRMASATALGGAYYLVRRVNGDDNEYVTAFFEGIAQNRKYGTERVLPDDDPRSALLARLAANARVPKGRPKAPVIEVVGWFIRAWNNVVEGNNVAYLRPYSLAQSPAILVCKPGEGAVPRALVGEVEPA